MNSKTPKPIAVNDKSQTPKQGQTKEPQDETHDAEQSYVIGLDLSDRTAHLAVLGPAGEDWRAEKKIQLNVNV
jgi:hypothetical protein